MLPLSLGLVSTGFDLVSRLDVDIDFGLGDRRRTRWVPWAPAALLAPACDSSLSMVDLKSSVALRNSRIPLPRLLASSGNFFGPRITMSAMTRDDADFP